MSIEAFVPQILEPPSGDKPGYGTMIVELHECPTCKAPTIAPWRNTAQNPVFPQYAKVDFAAQVNRAGWRLSSGVHHEGSRLPVCAQCAAEDRAMFRCALCGKERRSSESVFDTGYPPEHLCKHCYETVPAAQWNAKKAELEHEHRHDLD